MLMIEVSILSIAILIYAIAQTIESACLKEQIDELKDTTDSLINDVQTIWDSTMNVNVIECDFQPNSFSEGTDL